MCTNIHATSVKVIQLVINTPLNCLNNHETIPHSFHKDNQTYIISEAHITINHTGGPVMSCFYFF